MSTIAQIELPATEFALDATLATNPDIEFDIERVVAHGPDHVLPLVWVIGDEDDLEYVEASLREDPSVEDFELVSALDDRRVYRMDWVANIRLIVRILVEEEATILNAHAREGHWTLRVLFGDRKSLSRTYDFCEDADIALNVKTVHDLAEGEHSRFGLTEEQHEALVTATKRGYYAVPRIIGIHDLAAELGISHQALSERLRRGQENLNRHALIVEREAEHEDEDGSDTGR